MFGRRCTLCNGKLDRNNICTECGLNNKVSEKNYRINQSSCDGMPMTHVHEHEERRRQEKIPKMSVPKTSVPRTNAKKTDKTWQDQYRQKETTVRQPQGTQWQPARRKGSRKGISVIILVIMVLMIGSSIFSAIGSIFEEYNDYGGFDYGTDYEYDPYEHVDAELAETGDTVEYTLTSGSYEVGVHIPEGLYTAEMNSEFDSVQVEDSNNGIYLYEYEGKDEENYLDDLRLFTGAKVVISSESEVVLKSENAQTQTLNYQENPLTVSVTINDTDTKAAGVDFEAGVYDVSLLDGEGGMIISVLDGNGNEMSSEGIYLGEYASDGMEYKNLVLPENAEITCDSEMEILLTPSPVIRLGEYSDYYLY